MSSRRLFRGLAACALAAAATTGARASDASITSPPAAPPAFDAAALSLTPKYPMDMHDTQREPLMAWLDKMGWAKPLDDARITIFGAIQASYTYDLSNP